MSKKKLLIVVAVLTVLCLVLKLFGGDSYQYPQDAINGDVNMDGQGCMDDSIQIIYHLWRDGRDLPCPDAADLDRNGVIDVTDVLGGLRYIFFGDSIVDCPISCYPN